MTDKLRYCGQPVEYEPGERWFVTFGFSNREFAVKSIDFRSDRVVINPLGFPVRSFLGKKIFYRVVPGVLAEPPRDFSDTYLPAEGKIQPRRIGLDFFLEEEAPIFKLRSLSAQIFNDQLDILYCTRRQLNDLPIQREGDAAYIMNREVQLRRHGIRLEYRNLSLCMVFENGDYIEGVCVFRFHRAQQR